MKNISARVVFPVDVEVDMDEATYNILKEDESGVALHEFIFDKAGHVLETSTIEPLLISMITTESEMFKGLIEDEPIQKLYRRKPVVITAYQTDVVVNITTLEGVMTANVGDYIITGITGEKYPCKPGIFEISYEEIF